MKGYKIFSLILSFLLISCIHVYAEEAISSSISKHQNKLFNITKQIDKKKSELKLLSMEEKNTLIKLSAVEKEIKIGVEKLNRINNQLDNVYRDICSTERSIYLTSWKLKNRQNLLLKRLNAIYKYRGGDLLDILFNTDSLTEMSKRLYFMALIAKADTELIEDIKREKNAYLQRERILQANHNKISEIKKSQQRVLSTQERLKKDRVRLLSEIRGKKSLYSQQIAELERNSLELRQLIKSLEAKRIEREKYFIGREKYVLHGSGNLPWPVKNRKLYREFGKYKHPKFDVFVMNKGIDILADKGETVTSINEGNVIFANWFKGYGMLVIIDHGKGLYSLYANLAKILVSCNQRVSKGTPIGKIGNPMAGDIYNFHFEIRVNGEPVNPLNWLTRG